METASRKATLWTKDFVLALAAKLFSSMVFASLSATLASYALFVFGSTSAEAGFLVGVFVLSSVVSRVLAGRYADLVGCKRIMVWSTGLFFALMPLYFVPTSFGGMVVLRVAHGLLFGVLNNTITLAATRCIPGARFGEGMAYFSLSITLSTAVGPGVAVLLASLGWYDAIFISCTVYAAITFAACAFLRIPVVEITPEERHEMLHSFRLNDFFELKSLPIVITVMVLNACHASVSSFVSAYSMELGLALWTSWYFVAYSVVMFVTRPSTGRLYDRKGPNAVMYPFTVLMAAGLLLLALCPMAGVVALLGAAALLGVGYGTVHSTCQTICVQAASPQRAGVATSTFYLFADVGLALGPTVMGFMYPVMGYEGMYVIAGVVTLAGLVFYHAFCGRKLKEKTA